MVRRKWSVSPRASTQRTAAFAGLDSLLVQLLLNRGITTPDEAFSFIAADENLTHDPMLLDDMVPAVERLMRALVLEEPIAVYGDFDADGITSTVLLTQVLRALGGNAIPYIPHRIDEGYGLNCPALHSLHKRGVKLVVTVDCGISSIAEVEYAQGLGLEVIITDHHTISGLLPGAVAAINPKRKDSRYPFADLAGVGVAFKLAQALIRASGETQAIKESALLDLVALGTVADLAPLVGENRYLVRRGLEVLNNTTRPGLHEMVLLAGLRLGALDAGTIGYVIGPRLNAAGRLDDAIVSYNLLSTSSPATARELASVVEAHNQERQRLTSEAIWRAKAETAELKDQASLVMVSGEGYVPGIVGLVAGKLAEELYRPVLVMEQGEEECRGSARSIPEFNIIAALEQCRDLLVRFGGHAQAAGFTLRTERLAEFRHRLGGLAVRELSGKDLSPTLQIDAEVSLTELSWAALRNIQQLAPFGYGNPTPTFLSKRVKVVDCRTVGAQNNHLRLKLHDGRNYWSAIAFHQAASLDGPVPYLDLVYSLEANEWNDNQYLQLRVKDLQPSL